MAGRKGTFINAMNVSSVCRGDWMRTSDLLNPIQAASLTS
jgi:hypothetical protein